MVTEAGFPLGALCVIDREPRQLEENQIKALQTLSRQVIRLFELIKLVKEKDKQDAEMGKTCHDMKSYLRKMELSAEVLIRKHENQFDDESQGLLNDIQNEASQAINLINSRISS